MAAEFLASDGVRLHYADRGHGDPPLIFVPGWAMPGSVWRAQLDYFAPKHRVIAFDPRGQGRSEVAAGGYTPERRSQDIAELIAASGAQRPVLVGWSLAVLEILAYVKAHGDRACAGLVLVDNSVGEEPPPSYRSNFVAALRSNRQAAVRGFVHAMFKTERTPAELDALTVDALRLPLPAAVSLLSWSWPRTAWRDALYATGKPVLYVVTPRFAAQAANVHRRRPDIEVEVFPDAGHALFVDEPGRFNLLLERFLASTAHADSGHP